MRLFKRRQQPGVQWPITPNLDIPTTTVGKWDHSNRARRDGYTNIHIDAAPDLQRHARRADLFLNNVMISLTPHFALTPMTIKNITAQMFGADGTAAIVQMYAACYDDFKRGGYPKKKSQRISQTIGFYDVAVSWWIVKDHADCLLQVHVGGKSSMFALSNERLG